jgi:hypothetical protein
MALTKYTLPNWSLLIENWYSISNRRLDLYARTPLDKSRTEKGKRKDDALAETEMEL